jgi:ABC-type branched-subunit amino acid transport system substrate-binding protein
MQLRKNRFVRALGVVTLVGLIAAGCGSDASKTADDTTSTTASEFVRITDVPGVTDTEIHFSAVSTSTGKNPTGECSLECFTGGVKAYFAYRNDQGGIYGRKLVLDDPIDDELGGGQKAALQVLSDKDTLATFTYTLIAPYEEFIKANWPVYTYLTDHTAAKGKLNVFGTFSTSAFDVPRIDQVYVPKAIGATKIASIGYAVGSSQTCVDQTVNAFKGEYKDSGIEVVYSNKSLAFGLPNGVAPEVTAMKQAGVELVFTCTEANGLKAFAQEMKRQNLVAPLVTFSGFEDDFIAANADVLEGSIEGIRIRLPTIASATKGTKAFEEWTKKANVQVKYTTYHGWGAADQLFQGLKKAGPNFNQQKLIDATNTIEHWTADGLFAPVDIGRQHEGQSPDDPRTHGDDPHCFSYLQVKDGKLTLMKPQTTEKPYVCWPLADDYKYTEPVAMSFE